MLSTSESVSTRHDDLATQEAHVVLASARALQQAAHAGHTVPLLRGKNFALMAESADEAPARLFARAATELGANVVLIRPSVSKLGTRRDIRDTAGMLGRLYDAIACEGLPDAQVRQIRDDAGVPVYDGLAADAHPSAVLAQSLEDDGMDDRRRYVLQAVLVTTLG